MKYTITLYDAQKELPIKSGLYFTITNDGHLSELHYSEEYELFNVYDDPETAIFPDFWAKIPEVKDLYRQL